MTGRRKRAVVSWSTGKDCAWALHRVRREATVEPVGLLVTVNARFRRVSMHGVRLELAERQAEALGLPLIVVELPWPCTNEEYEARMAATCRNLRQQGVEAIVFGDIHLAEVRAYRESRLAGTGLEPLFPLWGMEPSALIAQMLEAGLRCLITCLDPARMDRSLAGAELTTEVIQRLPAGVDPCGENGEFHTFAFAGPMFRHPLAVADSGVVERDGFVYADLAAADSPPG